jgi:uncharacterized protein (DUF1330 family)
MSAYVLIDLDTTDPVAANSYRNELTNSLAAYDGKFLVRRGAPDVFAGQWQPKNIVLVEFEDAARARQWLASPSHTLLKDIVDKVGRTNIVILPGG